MNIQFAHINNNSFIQSEMASNIQSTSQSIDKSIINNNNNNNNNNLDDFNLGSNFLLEGVLMKKMGRGGSIKKKEEVKRLCSKHIAVPKSST